MFWYDHGVGGWGWAGMTIGMVLFWGLIIGGGILLFRALGRTGSSDTGTGGTAERPSPEQLLAERFARGEIDEEEYHRRLSALQATHRPPAHRT